MDDQDFVNPDAVEVEETDEEQISASYERDRFREAVLMSSDWTTETILTQLSRKNIFLAPRFQRRDAWTIPNKSRFIESLIIGLPIPQIVLAERKEERGKYIVLDGKQRLLSMLQFVGQAENDQNNAFKLKGLEIAENLEGKTYQDLCEDITYVNELNCFHNQPIRAVVIRNWPDLTFLHLVFLRLNTGSVKLSPQELRQALFPGPFSDFIDQATVDSPILKRLLHLEQPDFRMRDVELLVRYLAFQNFLVEYRGEMKQFLDETCNNLNRNWETVEPQIRNQLQGLEMAGAAAIEIFGMADIARRPAEEGGRRLFNRAIFDVLMFYFSREDVRTLALTRKESVKAGFNQLWQTNPEFVKSIESTTKSIPATFTRLSAWGNKLSEVLEIDVRVPVMEGNRIQP